MNVLVDVHLASNRCLLAILVGFTNWECGSLNPSFSLWEARAREEPGPEIKTRSSGSTKIWGLKRTGLFCNTWESTVVELAGNTFTSNPSRQNDRGRAVSQSFN